MESTYVFARNSSQKEKMVFVQRVRFHSIMQFYCFDLMNGLHHGHAPCVCQNCERYFLTRNGHKPKYCSGMAPQDSRLTCRQYGAMMHQKEQNKQHPVYRLFSTCTTTIRKHHQRGKSPTSCGRKRCILRRPIGTGHSWTTTMLPETMSTTWNRKRFMLRREHALPRRTSHEHVSL